MPRACDRVDVQVVLASGVVVPDRSFERPAPTAGSTAVAPDVEWTLLPGATTVIEGDDLTISFDVLPDELVEERGRVSVARTRRTVHVELDKRTLGWLVNGLSEGRTIPALVCGAPPNRQDEVRNLLTDLVGWGAVVSTADIRSRLAHEWSMRGARSRSRLTAAEVATLTFTPQSREDDARVVDLPDVRPFLDDSLENVLHRRRSPTSYDGSPISVDQLGQLLGGACGVTGELVLGDRSLPLRAYPSPGALYAVDVYVVPVRVDGLETGAFRYDPERHVLVTVHNKGVDPVSFCLPDVRAVVGGIATFIALAAYLPRATRKYGDESYRILVAEAGCIAENLVLVAHAIGLRAAPFTGVFDGLVDQALGLDHQDGRFVVGVLVGREASPS